MTVAGDSLKASAPAGAGCPVTDAAEIPHVTNYVLLIDDGNPKLVMILDPNASEPDKPFWKLLGRRGQPHKVQVAWDPRVQA